MSRRREEIGIPGAEAGASGPGSRRFWVRVPGSTSNLGPGFDALGMAVDTFLEVTWESAPEATGGTVAPGMPTDSAGAPGPPGRMPPEVFRTGTLEGASWPVEEDLVVQAMQEVYDGIMPHTRQLADTATDSDAESRPPPRGRLHMHSEIPLGRGLGSSAAARVAGAVLAHLVAHGAADRQTVLGEAAAREGHPDNAAPALLGGLVAATLEPEGRVVAVPLPLSQRIGWVFAMPGVGLDTGRARAALPKRIPHPAAVRNTGRLALLIPALAAGDGPLLARAMEDELHVPYRLPLVPGAEEAVRAARAAGAWGVTLSGAGSGLIAAVPRGSEAPVGEAMARCFQAHPEARGGSWRALRPWTAGAQWGSGAIRPPGPERFATSRG